MYSPFRLQPQLTSPRLTIAILDSRRRVIGLLGGAPQGAEDWADVTERASKRMHERISRLSLSPEKLDHRRAQQPFAAVSRGPSHGGGQTEPGELQQNQTNTTVTDELLEDPDIQRIVGWINLLFFLWAPKLYSFYQQARAALEKRHSLKWNFVKTIFAACTFNFGPQAITRHHLDFGNLSWGWCAVTALGWFDPDLGGHLILWDLRLVIRFPPGSTIFIPSALIRHSNVPIRPHEIRSSFTQYTAGGLFRWIRNGFMTDKDYERTAPTSDQAARAEEAKTRWKEGMDMFSKIDEL
ncbi:hypothetical protein K438DRAFT_1639066 [Mycena galopus ATCC 62051]|nr:hypothetical protein K438DRAFT_1639066 [Mycena galopus ATCC 62051]